MSTLSPFLLSRNEWESREAFVGLGSGLAGANQSVKTSPEEKGLTKKNPVRSKGKKGGARVEGSQEGIRGPYQREDHQKCPPSCKYLGHHSVLHISLARLLTKSLSCHHLPCSPTSLRQSERVCPRDTPSAPVLLPWQSVWIGSGEGCFPLPASPRAAWV